jgi:hypothetical protein
MLTTQSNFPGGKNAKSKQRAQSALAKRAPVEQHEGKQSITILKRQLAERRSATFEQFAAQTVKSKPLISYDMKRKAPPFGGFLVIDASIAEMSLMNSKNV